MPDAASAPIEPFEVPRSAGPRFLFIGRLEARKGPIELAEAFAIVCRRFPDAALWVVGADISRYDGFLAKYGLTYLEKMRQVCGEHAGKLHHFGAVSEGRKNALIASCDALVVSSLYESFGLTLLEAMRFGKPVVASDTGGIPEVVEDRASGLLVEPGSAASLAEAMVALGDDAGLRARLGSRGLERFHELFELEKCANRTLAFYRDRIACY